MQTKLEDLNPRIPLEGLQEALRKIRLISHPTLIENNREFHRLLVEGVDVEFRNREGQVVHDKVWLIDFANPEANEFLAVNQFAVEEGQFNRRADVLVFINGIPVAVLELKNITDTNATIRGAFNQLQTYEAQIPSLFNANALLVISDGHEARLGTMTSDWERFMTWRTVTGKDLVAVRGLGESGLIERGNPFFPLNPAIAWFLDFASRKRPLMRPHRRASPHPGFCMGSVRPLNSLIH
ncbi:MAG TPA: type I restriction endonuclease [Verrucomicrobiae bacterium]|nr:type I restriction endonuclease [Verrucomicrobiae bacterium]